MNAAGRGAARAGSSILAMLAVVGCTQPHVLGTPVFRRPAAPPSELAAVPVRAELAAVLLNAGRYREAAREYGRLVELDGRNPGYRLGLARALAWDGRYRDAEAHLRVLAGRQPGVASVDSLLTSVRANLAPSAREAEVWVAERPAYRPYRVARARALLREGQATLALGYYHELIASRPTPELLAEAADAYAAAGDRARGLALLQRHLAAAPSDTAVRRHYAARLAADRQFEAALAHNDTALSWAYAPNVLIDRARIQILRDRLDEAESTLHESAALGGTADAYLLLGDVHRWQWEFDEARAAYRGARALSPGDRSAAAGLARVAREERPAPVAPSLPGTEPGWTTSASVASDNGGVRYTRLEGRRGFDLRGGLTASGGVELRELREASAFGADASRGVAVDLAVARTGVEGPFVGTLEARLGLVGHLDADVVPMGALTVRAGYQAWIVAATRSAGPAYPSLLTVASLAPHGRSAPLRESAWTVAAGGPFGLADAAITWHRADLSDGNGRSTLSVAARYPLAPRLTALYAANSISYDRRSGLYWDPNAYLASAVGIEVAERRPRGLSYAARVLPGLAQAEETPFLRAPVGSDGSERVRLQVQLGTDVRYRRARWEIAAAYGFGRIGRYQRSEATLAFRLLP